jgi:hypothetical protein
MLSASGAQGNSGVIWSSRVPAPAPPRQVRDQPACVLMGDDLGRDDHQHAHRPARQREHVLLDVGGPRRQVHHQIFQAVPVGVGQQPPHQQLGDTAAHGQGLVLAEQEGRRRQLHPVLAHGLQPGIGRARPGEQRDTRGFGAPPQTHHARHVRTVQVGVDQAGPVPPRRQGQRQVHRDRGLADPALPASHRDDRHMF